MKIRSLSGASTIALVLAVSGFAQSSDEAIRKVLMDQAADWNRGDLRAFVQGYAPDAVFVGSPITRGREEVLQRYLRRYSTSETRGTLSFTDLEIRPLGPAYASVLGHFHLERSTAGGGPASGVFTLLLHKTNAGWQIILDHTS